MLASSIRRRNSARYVRSERLDVEPWRGRDVIAFSEILPSSFF